MLKTNAQINRGVLRARLEKADHNLYRAVYLGELNPEHPAGGQAWPDAHVGDTQEGVMAWVEQMAREMGYSRVDWEP